MKNHHLKLAGALMAWLLMFPVLAFAEEQDLLIFLSIDPAYNALGVDDGVEQRNTSADADFIYSYLDGRFHFLSEFLFSTEEVELERLQFGLMLEDQGMLWVGRFHSPSRYWNYAYHHGRFLQTSISRPFVDLAEDFGGIFPTHILGLLFESSFAGGGQDEFQLSASMGITSVLNRQKLEPLDLLAPESGHQSTVDARLAYLPDQLKENQFGITLSYAELPVAEDQIADLGLDSVTQLTSSFYVDWRFSALRVISSLARSSNQLNRLVGVERGWFLLAYTQLEYAMDARWTAFGRLEKVSRKNDAEYLSLFPDAILERKMIGARLDLNETQALSVEASSVSTAQKSFSQYLLQWSMVLK